MGILFKNIGGNFTEYHIDNAVNTCPSFITISRAEYDELPDDQKRNGIIYCISDEVCIANEVIDNNNREVKELKQLQCKSCGAPLDYRQGDRSTKCKYCGSTYQIKYDW